MISLNCQMFTIFCKQSIVFENMQIAGILKKAFALHDLM